jgi:DNA-binding GntR family transcriptional regulator
VDRGEGTISVSTVTAREATLLGLKKELPALIFRAVARDTRQRKVEYLTSVNHPQRVLFKTV